MEEQVHSLIKKADNARTAGEALHYTQAALNAANALFTLQSLKQAQR